jgi:hypothetical protein
VYAGQTPVVKGIYAPFRPPKDRLSGKPDVMHILTGGDPFSPKDVVTPGILSAAGASAIPETMGGRRKALADWIADAENPLRRGLWVANP